MVSILSCLTAFVTIMALRWSDPSDSISPGQCLVSKHLSRSASMSSIISSIHSTSSSSGFSFENILHHCPSSCLSAAFSPPGLISVYRLVVNACILSVNQPPGYDCVSVTSSLFISVHSLSGMVSPCGFLRDIPSVAPMVAPGTCCMTKL